MSFTQLSLLFNSKFLFLLFEISVAKIEFNSESNHDGNYKRVGHNGRDEFVHQTSNRGAEKNVRYDNEDNIKVNE